MTDEPVTGDPAGLSFATILDWTEGRLDDAESAVVAAAALTDPRVRDIVAWLTGFRRTAAELPLVDPPPVVTQRLRALFARRGAGARGLTPTVASLLVDSRRDVATTGVRDGGADDPDGTIRLAYTSDVADVVLDVRRVGGERVDIDGQVLLPDVGTTASAFAVEATTPGAAPVRSVGGDRRGRFRLVDVPERVSSLRLDNGEVAVVLRFDLRSTGS